MSYVYYSRRDRAVRYADAARERARALPGFVSLDVVKAPGPLGYVVVLRAADGAEARQYAAAALIKFDPVAPVNRIKAAKIAKAIAAQAERKLGRPDKPKRKPARVARTLPRPGKPIAAFEAPEHPPTPEQTALDRDKVKRALDEHRAQLVAARMKAAAERAEARKAARAAAPPPRSRWAEYFSGAPAVVRQRVAAGKPAFRPGSKRELYHHAMIKGATITELTALLQWNAATVKSALHEMSHLTQRKIEQLPDGRFRYVDADV